MTSISPITNVWSSIINFPKISTCWICGEPFQKGKQKKMLEVCDILRYLKEISVNNDELATINSENLQQCGLRYSEVNGDDTIISNDLTEANIADWMSTLICGRSEHCAQIYANILKGKSNTAKSNMIAKKMMIRKTADGKECPPDCDCDNPWPFLTIGMKKK
mmetsp:Transcript_33768/g.34405  ORF Transcript_33768/g.34405 Transcript_33768/m.34405 type:complete len:163 (-) Transcript_33768:43-531(-)